jgi:hypothetical protein
MVLFGPVARGGDQPADGERLGALGAHLDRDLVGRTADAAATDLDCRSDIVQRVVETRRSGPLAGAVSTVSRRTIDDAFGDRLLAVQHDAVHELGQDQIAELRDRQEFRASLGDDDGDIFSSFLFSRFRNPSGAYSRALLGRLAPYLERLCGGPCTLGVEHAGAARG